MTNYRNKIKPYLDDLEKKGVGLGGGSAGALAFCLGCSLVAKSINHTKSKDISKLKKNKLDNRLVKVKELKKKIYPYIDQDGQLFAKMIKNKGKERKKYLKKVNHLLKTLARSSYKVFLLAKELDFDIKKGIKSDFNLGINFIKIAMKSATYNLDANNKISGKKDNYLKDFKNKFKKMEKE
ncbi:MAG: cyclodeaminase/cyclohydrolase family protein [Candidatus Omnitrophica bacterium]|nr:cyclodeaminase/cyclohydrolase family protein [Candidatus Omnitrophota bacterium]MCF7894131.1 cyclodeaminase/cyclohydrolase family protein [Candidatus Omnitrophota bacterium]